MNKVCPRCGKSNQNSANYCTSCGNDLIENSYNENNLVNNKNKKGLYKLVLITICIFGFLIIVFIIDNSETSYKESDSGVKVNEQKENNNSSKNKGKTIKMGSKEYFSHINDVLLKVQNESNNLTLKEYRKRGVTYLVASFYTNKYLSAKEMNNEIKNAMKIFYDNFSINKYKSGGLFSSDYEYLNITFYNYESAKVKKYDEYEFIQLDFTMISNYSDFDVFYSRETKCISGC